MKTSKLEEEFENQLKEAKLKKYEREFKFHPERRWRFDFAFVKEKVAIETEGGAFMGGRHTNPMGFTKDCDKYNAAIELGWRVLRGTSVQVKNKTLLEILKRILK